MFYDPSHWYWTVGGDAGRVYSSSAAAYVQVNDPAYIAWLAKDNLPTQIDTEDNLNAVLLTAYPPGALHGPTQLSPLSFIGRFTSAEQSAVTTAALASAPLLLWLMQAMGAQYIDLTDPRTKAGLEALVAAGLLTAERETAILTP